MPRSHVGHSTCRVLMGTATAVMCPAKPRPSLHAQVAPGTAVTDPKGTRSGCKGQLPGPIPSWGIRLPQGSRFKSH